MTSPTPAENGQALAAPPVFDEINERRLALLKATVAKDANDAEIGAFLELCSKYDLDPFAKECWLAKSPGRDGSSGRLLIMVGRDGLRKIAQRSGIYLDGDVVRENDEFKVVRGGDRQRSIHHAYAGDAAARGPIVGAWAEAVDAATGRQAGYFYAHLGEYKPTNAKQLQYSPWGAQESVMILAAAERQALRQATPLSGMLAEGETDLNAERAGPVAVEVAPGAPADSAALLTAVEDLGLPHSLRARVLSAIGAQLAVSPSSWFPAKVGMVFGGKDNEAVLREIEAVEAEAAEIAPPDAEVVHGTSHGAPTDEAPPEQAADADMSVVGISPGGYADEVRAEMAGRPPEERATAYRTLSLELLAEADALRHRGEPDLGDEAEAAALALRDEADALFADAPPEVL